MSYTDDYGGATPTQVGYFSNPSVSYRGAPTGHAADGDNARTIREIKTVISNYRSEAGTNTLTISAGTGGTTSPAPGIYTHATDSIVRVTALPNTHFRFVSWSGSYTGTQNPTDIVLDRDKTLAASFQRIIYAPANASGQKVLNRSLSQAEYINILTFAANSNNVDILSYTIYQVEGGQKTKVGSVDATTFLYWHRGVDGSQTYTYYIAAVNGEGREGDSAVVVI